LLGLIIYRFGELDWHTEESPETQEYVAESRGGKDCHSIGIRVLNWLFPTWGPSFFENCPAQTIQPATFSAATPPTPLPRGKKKMGEKESKQKPKEQTNKTFATPCSLYPEKLGA